MGWSTVSNVEVNNYRPGYDIEEIWSNVLNTVPKFLYQMKDDGDPRMVRRPYAGRCTNIHGASSSFRLAEGAA